MAKSKLTLKTFAKNNVIAALVIGTFFGYGASFVFGANAAPKPSGVSAISVAAGSDLRLGGYVWFNTTVEKLAGWEYPMVATSCFQNTNLVYVDLVKPAEKTLLGGGSSAWLTNGGPANCVSQLDAYGWKSGKESIRVLAQTAFDAAGQ